MDWTHGHTDSFEFIRVRGGIEYEALSNIKPNGTITRDLNTDLKVSGSLECVGDLGIGSDLIRIYLTAATATGSVRLAIATMFASTPSRTLTDTSTSAKVTLYSTLLQLVEDCFETTYAIPAGTNAIELATQLATSAGLQVKATPSPSTTTAVTTFEAGTSKLKVINYLLDFANYYSAQVDGYGTVIMRPYQSPATRQAVWTFVDGDGSIFVADVTDEHDWYATPNVVVCYTSNTTTDTLTATAVNDGSGIYAGSGYSTVARGRRIVKTQSYTDIADQVSLQAKADALLLSSSSTAQTVTVKHAYAPIDIGDVIELDYSSQSIDYDATVQSMDMTLSPSVETTTKMRRFSRG